jgi:hypothetical protein
MLAVEDCVMRYRTLLVIAAVALLIGAMTLIDTQHIQWDPPWPVRLGMGVAGVLLALGALLAGRRGRSETRGSDR